MVKEHWLSLAPRGESEARNFAVIFPADALPHVGAMLSARFSTQGCHRALTSLGEGLPNPGPWQPWS